MKPKIHSVLDEVVLCFFVQNCQNYSNIVLLFYLEATTGIKIDWGLSCILATSELLLLFEIAQNWSDTQYFKAAKQSFSKVTASVLSQEFPRLFLNREIKLFSILN